MLLFKFGSFGHAVSEEKIFFGIDQSEKQTFLWRPCLLADRDEIGNRNREPSIDASYQVSIYLTMRFQRRRLFRNRTIRKKNFLWRPSLLSDREEMGNLF
jgi:hypothetical protein